MIMRSPSLLTAVPVRVVNRYNCAPKYNPRRSGISERTLARANHRWLEFAGVPLPDRLSLLSVDASDLGDVTVSRIREGYTQEEREAGVN
jgi:hypothetical protein